MKAIVYDKFGPPEVLHTADVPKPVPADNEVLIKVRATTVSSGDWRVRSLKVPAGFGPIAPLIYGFSKPRKPILGTELAGDVEAVGRNVKAFRVGDRVFAYPGGAFGAHAEYKTMREDSAIAHTPANLTDDEAAALSFGGTTALSFLRRAGIRNGDKVLVNGASGAVGSAAVQLARYFGAEVTGVSSGANAELVRSIGADKVIDYTKADFTASGETYDIIMDTTGTAPFARSRKSLKKGGRLLLVAGTLADLFSAPWHSMTTDKKVIGGPAPEKAEDLRFLAELAAAGKYKPVIGRRFPFEQMVEAHRHVDTGRKVGSVVVTLS